MGEFYLIRSRHGTWLGVDDASGAVVCREIRGGEGHRRILTAYVSPFRPTMCFLAAESAGVRRLSMLHGLDCDMVLPLGIAPNPQAAKVALYHPDTGKWVCAEPTPDGGEFGRAVADRDNILAYEEFTLVPLQTELVATGVRGLADRLDRMLAAPLGPEAILAMAPQDAPILQAVARTIPPLQLAVLARALVALPEACRKLAQIYAEDPFATLALPALATWLAWRSASNIDLQNWHMTLGPELDAIGSLGAHGEYVSFAHACNALARRAVEPRHDVCAIATARNEGLYLLDWIAYHRALGIEAFFIYSNDNDDGSDALLAALARGQAIHWVDNKVEPGVNSPQFKAYAHALSIRPDVLDYRWALITDLDEYLVLDPATFTSVTDYLRWQEVNAVDAIALNWSFYGSCGKGAWEDEFIVRRFPGPFGEPNPHVKSLVRPRQFINSLAHFPIAYRREPYIFRNAAALPHVPHPAVGAAWSATPVMKHAWINHYFYKSTEEFLLKWSRNRGDHPTVKDPSNDRVTPTAVRDFMAQFAQRKSALADPEAAAPGYVAELARLMAIPGVAEALARIKEGYRARVNEIIPLFVDAPGIREAGSLGKALLATLGLEGSPAAGAAAQAAPEAGQDSGRDGLRAAQRRSRAMRRK